MKLIKCFKFIVLRLCAVLLLSCSSESGIYRDAVSLQDAEKRFQANAGVLQSISLIRKVAYYVKDNYGLQIDEKSLRFLPGSQDVLAWHLIALPKQNLAPEIDVLLYDTKTVEIQKTKAQTNGLEVYIFGENPLWIKNKPAPFLESWARWPYDRQVERSFQLLFYQYIGETLKRADADQLSRFLAEKATEEYLLATLGGASPVLSRYISEQRDEKTFAALYPDFLERVVNVYAYKDPAASADNVEATRNQLLKVWIAEFKKRYTERFLTNRYAQFGSTIPSNGEIVALKKSLAVLENWKQYQGEYRRAGESVAAYLKVLTK